MQGGEGAPLEVFYSYSHDDEEYRKKLGKHLAVLRRAGLITDWHDRDIDAGTAWQEEIDRHLLSADIVLLLVSASFIASDYCWGDEMRKALARHNDKKARVIPIILHPCGWLRTPLQALQGVPRDNKAISLWANEHAAFDHVVTEIAKVVDDLRRSKTNREQSSQASADAIVASTPSPPHPPADAGPSLSRRKRGGARAVPPPESSLSPERESGEVRAAAKDGIYIGVDPRELPDLAVFKDLDAPWCPELVVIPAGTFLMGSPPDERERLDSEGPQRRVTIDDRFAIGRYAVTFAEYDYFCEETNHEKPADEGWGRGWQPVINVGWRDAKAFVDWLSRETRQAYRLPSEAEWEYACRAGTTTPFCFGRTITPSQVNYDGRYTYAGCAKGVFRAKTVPVGSMPANPWALHEMHGNVWEWVEDNWHEDYSGAPACGTAWTDSEGRKSSLLRVFEGASRLRVIRGGSWSSDPCGCRSAYRSRVGRDYLDRSRGFRVARTLD